MSLLGVADNVLWLSRKSPPKKTPILGAKYFARLAWKRLLNYILPIYHRYRFTISILTKCYITVIKKRKVLFVGGQNMRQTNQRWKMATLLKKNRKITIYTQGLTDFAQSGILYTEWVIRDKFRKSKMGMATILIKKYWIATAAAVLPILIKFDKLTHINSSDFKL